LASQNSVSTEIGVWSGNFAGFDVSTDRLG